jgi:MFS family permease
VVLAALLMLATLPGRTQGLGLVTEPLLADLRLDRVTYANLNLWATLVGALFCFPTGWAIDRLGLRWVTGSILFLLGVSVWGLSEISSSVVPLFGLLLATRALGQSALSVCSIATVARRFPSHAGFAMGVYSVLLSIFFAMAFGIVGYSVRVNGWRVAWFQVALALLGVFLPLVLLVLREPKADARSLSPNQLSRSMVQFSLMEALRTSSFWVFASSAATFNLVSSGLGLFNEAVLAERGFDQTTFHLFLAVTTLMSLAGQFLCGWLTRRWSYQSLTSISMVLYALGLSGIPLISQHWQLWMLSVLLGCAGGMIIVIFFSVWSDLFGQRHLGRIQGAAQMLTVLSSGLGPLLFAKCAEAAGSYAPLLFSLSGITVLLAIIAKVMQPPSAPRNPKSPS